MRPYCEVQLGRLHNKGASRFHRQGAKHTPRTLSLSPTQTRGSASSTYRYGAIGSRGSKRHVNAPFKHTTRAGVANVLYGPQAMANAQRVDDLRPELTIPVRTYQLQSVVVPSGFYRRLQVRVLPGVLFKST